jgi:hypothetical protein
MAEDDLSKFWPYTPSGLKEASNEANFKTIFKKLHSKKIVKFFAF